MLAWIDGVAGESIDVLNRGLHYGDGLFETMRIRHASIPFLSLHMQRLRRDCARLGIDNAVCGVLEQELKSLAAVHEHAIVKVIVTRGVAQTRGYVPPQVCQPTRIVMLWSTQDYLQDTHVTQGARLTVCHMRLSMQTALAGIKHLNKLEYVLAAQELQSGDYDDGVLLDSDAYVVECTKANLLWVQNSRFYTPDLSASGVKGVMRQALIEWLLTQRGIQVQERKIDLMGLLRADELIICNSVIGAWPVYRVGDKFFRVGEVNTLIQDAVAELWSD